MTRIQTLPQLENADDPQVSAYLDKHPELVTVLNEAVGELRKDFPEERFRLDVENDMEDEEGTPYLVLSILSTGKPDDVREAYKRFFFRWCSDYPHRQSVGNKLVFRRRYVSI